MPDRPQASRRAPNAKEASDSAAQGNVVPSAGGVVINATGHVLVIRRWRPPLAGEWTLPGGRIESGESPEAAVVRELREETALHVRVVAALGAVRIAHEGSTYVIHEFLAVAIDPAHVSPGDDAADAQWAAPEVLEALGVRDEALRVVERGLAEAQKRGLVAAPKTP